MQILKTLFFSIDNLHIQLSERYFILSLTTIYITMVLVNPIIRRESPYNEEYYAPLMEAFYQQSAENYLERRSVIERYYPGDENLIEHYARVNIPASYEAEILEKASETLNSPPSSNRLLTDTEIITTIVTAKPLISALSDSIESKININTAGVKELSKLPGIGKSIAERIIQFRDENGPFKSIDDIMKVRGIGAGRFNSFKHLLEV
jgi:competence ComEA-like helix-hairpin-helix protein